MLTLAVYTIGMVDETLQTGDNVAIALVQQSLQKNQGVAFGSAHNQISSREWLVENMPALKEAGVTQYYTEFVNSKDQVLLDEFMKHNPEAEALLKNYFVVRGESYGPGTGMANYAVLEAARAQGMNIVGLDSTAFIKKYNEISGQGLPENDYLQLDYADIEAKTFAKARQQVSNPEWKAIIDANNAEHLGSGKYIVDVGDAHTNTSTLLGRVVVPSASVRGIDQLLGIPSFDLGEKENSTEQDPFIIRSGRYGSTYSITLPQSENQRHWGPTAVGVAEKYEPPYIPNGYNLKNEVEKFKESIKLRDSLQTEEGKLATGLMQQGLLNGTITSDYPQLTTKRGLELG